MLRRFVKPVEETQLVALLVGAPWASESVEPAIDLLGLDAALESVDQLQGAAIDAALAVPFRKALPLTRRQAGDPGIWEWLAISHSSDFVWRRWGGGAKFPSSDLAELEGGLPGRFLYRPTLNGTSRHALARLWWVAEACASDTDTVKLLLANQTKFQAIFEREFGLFPPLYQALAPLLAAYPEDVINDAAARLQERLSATVLEALPSDALEELVTTCLAEAAGGKSAARPLPRDPRGFVHVQRAAGDPIDARFQTEAGGDDLTAVVIDSQGGTKGSPKARNTDYRLGIEILIERLGWLGAELVRVEVDSEPARRRLSESERVVDLDTPALPVALAGVDPAALRKHISSRARKVGQTSEQASTLGGSSRRMRFLIRGVDLEPGALEEALALGHQPTA